MPITPGVTINLKKGKSSHILLMDSEAQFTEETKVDSAKDRANGFTFTPKIFWRHNPTKLVIRLKTPARIRPLDPPPETGTITITLANPDKTISSDPVGYVDDDET